MRDVFTLQRIAGLMYLTIYYEATIPGRYSNECKYNSSKKNSPKKKGEILKEDFNAAKQTQLCRDLSKLCNHVGSLEALKKPLVYAWCGVHTYSKYMACKDEEG
mmetsp:Transcript_18885/g.27159  ORF Transcript_18885/g.27159 Transcript_18885/m.27159 type:complete len:104 (+) Transcript_18885:358-669(+)